MARTHYDVLMVLPAADRELITIVYRHLAKRYHPDHDGTPEAARRMVELNEAYAVLGDAVKRAQYDRGLGLAASPGVVAGAGDGAGAAGDGRPARSGLASPSTDTGPYGEAGPPPRTPLAQGRPLTFGRYRGWTLNQVDRFDHGYIEWLARTSMGRTFKQELDQLLRRAP
jgi:DnaJ-class molecular chaperone